MLSFDELVSLFDEQSKVVKEELTSALNVIIDRCVPSQDEIDMLDESFETLTERYSAIYKAANAVADYGELPPQGSSVQMLSEAYEKSLKRIANLQLVRTKEMLEHFINCMSHSDYYRIMDIARRTRKPVRYYIYAGANKCAEQIAKSCISEE